jgi:hypothetical protein|tara:strand:- start:6844 stop:7005 length:162 start_codon:yes stop_codon:yes gene_type:complete
MEDSETKSLEQMEHEEGLDQRPVDEPQDQKEEFETEWPPSEQDSETNQATEEK